MLHDLWLERIRSLQRARVRKEEEGRESGINEMYASVSACARARASPWRKKIYDLLSRKLHFIRQNISKIYVSLRQTMLKLQLSMRKVAVWNMFIDGRSFLCQVIITFYIFQQQSKAD